MVFSSKVVRWIDSYVAVSYADFMLFLKVVLNIRLWKLSNTADVDTEGMIFDF